MRIRVHVEPPSLNIIKMWEKYKNNFKEEAFKKHATIEYIDACLNYAFSLYKLNLPIVYDSNHFSQLVGYSNSYIHGVTNQPKKFYRKFKINKKNGGKRHISEPLPSLKEIQQWMLIYILSNLSPSKYAKAYRKGFSIKDNARFHQRQRYVLKLDIKHFFPSTTEKHIYKVYSNLGYTKQLAALFTKLSCLDNSLPQGAPTSPAISNIVLKPFDNRIGSFCAKKKIRYTRYSDDLTFSGDFNVGKLIFFTDKLLTEYKYSLNRDKIRLMEQHQRQIVTGITVNSKLSAPRQLRNFLRKESYYIKKFGLQSHITKANITTSNYIHKLIGLTNFALSICPDDKNLLDILEVFKLNSKIKTN